ncbi:MAG: type IX secretion system protein PorQ [Microscillaceae bacterium]|nr:type IX secretion system protein PorQ [Microscillaceae bacterium]
MTVKYRILIFLIFCQFALQAQVGGRQTFEFLRIPSHAHLAGVGGVNVSLGKEGVNMFLQNPAMLYEEAAKKGSFSFTNWQANINQFTVTYVQPFKKIGNLAFGVQALNYGTLERTTASGTPQGTFNASDYAVQATYALAQDNFHFGASLKVLGSQIEAYSAAALAVDLGASFQHPVQDFTLGLAIKNLGFPISRFNPDTRTNLPFDVQLGTSFKPKYMPFRFSVTLHHLYQFDIVYLDPALNTQLDINGDPIVEEKKFFDKLARHVVLGGELILAKGFQINLGYNHLINREMKTNGLGGLRGVSFGFLLKVKAFEFSYARGTYYIGAGRNFLTLTADFNKILKKKKKSTS